MCSSYENRDNAGPLAERLLDFESHEIARIVQVPSPCRIGCIQPVAANHNDESVSRAHRTLDLLGEFHAGQHGVGAYGNQVLAEALPLTGR